MQDPRTLPVLTAHAAHEAGHYTTARIGARLYPAYFAKVRFRLVTIIPDDISGGVVDVDICKHYTLPDPMKEPERLSEANKEPYLVHFMGGMAGQWIWMVFDAQKKIPTLEIIEPMLTNLWNMARADAGGKPDIALARKLVGKEDLKPFFIQAMHIMIDHWPALLRLTHALMDNRWLDARAAHLAWSGSNNEPSRGS